MYKKVKTTVKKMSKTAIIVVATIFIVGVANAQSKQSDIVGVWDGWYEANQGKTKLTLTINSDMTGMFEFTNMPGKSNVSPGSYTIVVDYSKGTYHIIGKEWIEQPFMYGFLNLNGKISNEKFSGKTEQGKRFQLERIVTAEQLREQEAERERQLQEQQAEEERQLQAKKAEEERKLLLIFTGYGVFIILMIVFFIRSRRKAKERKKEYQPIFVEIFKKRGFSATDVIWTNCQYKIKDYERVNNIVLGLKNDTLSFFGGGSSMVKFETKDEKVAFYNIAAVPNWRKLLKENSDFLLSDGGVAKILFPKNDNFKFRHLFDIPIHSIEDFEGKQNGKEVELLIEYSDDNLVKLSPVCGNVNPKIEIINAIIGALNKIMENGALSKTKISTINDKICDAIKEDSKITTKRQLKILGAVAGTALAIGGAAAASGARNWSKDR